MKSFRRYLLEQNTKAYNNLHFVSEGYIPIVPNLPKPPAPSETLQRQIFTQAPNLGPGGPYTQIVTRPTGADFSWQTPDGKIDPIVQASWADPRKGLISDTDKAWDFSEVGSAKLKEVKAKSPPYQAGYTSKRFYSLKGSGNLDTLKKFSAAIPDFHKRMGELADQFGTKFSYKVPHHPSIAASHTDTLVVHHYDLPDSSLSRSIDANTRKWAKDNGLEFLDRRGCDQGVDCQKEGSHSQRMANAIQGGAKGSLAQINQGIIDSSVSKIPTQPRQPATQPRQPAIQTLRNVSATRLAAVAAGAGALSQGKIW